MEIIFECNEDGDMPEGVHKDQIKEVYVDSMIGWLSVPYFTYPRNGNTYKFILK